jgi:hypothetical protein
MKMLMVSAGNKSLSANLTRSQGKATLRGQMYGNSPITLIFNARVQIPPAELHAAIEEHLKAVCGETIQLQITGFRVSAREGLNRFTGTRQSFRRLGHTRPSVLLLRMPVSVHSKSHQAITAKYRRSSSRIQPAHDVG